MPIVGTRLVAKVFPEKAEQQTRLTAPSDTCNNLGHPVAHPRNEAVEVQVSTHFHAWHPSL